MGSAWVSTLLLAALCGGLFVATGQGLEGDETDEAATEESPPSMPTPAGAAIWTDKLGYLTGEQYDVYLSTAPNGDTNSYTEFIYLQDLGTGLRKYLAPKANATALSETLVDSSGMARGEFETAPVSERTKRRVHRGSVPVPGLWQLVLEIRSADTTQAVKRAYSKFVVAQSQHLTLGDGGTDTEISEDTVWSNDRIYKVEGQVFVTAGVTLTIEPGTLILAKGDKAAIVVEKGGKIKAEGHRKAPIVMTCADAVGARAPGCWAGLIVLGNAPTTRSQATARGIYQAARSSYGGDDPDDSSGVLRYVRVEFAGGGPNPAARPGAFGFHGVGSGTVIDHIQAHASGEDGIEFFGGTADCTYCVSSGSTGASFKWAFGWQGTAQHVFIQQAMAGSNGVEGDNDSSGFDRSPRSSPTLYNITMIGGSMQGSTSTSGDGMVIGTGSTITARNVLVTGFGDDALVVRDNSPTFFTDGTSRVENAIMYANGGQRGDAQISGVDSDFKEHIGYLDTAPLLVNVSYEANPDPRPTLGSPALEIGAGAVPPSDGTLDTRAQYIGAFGDKNWLEEWTFFGAEADY